MSVKIIYLPIVGSSRGVNAEVESLLRCSEICKLGWFDQHISVGATNDKISRANVSVGGRSGTAAMTEIGAIAALQAGFARC